MDLPLVFSAFSANSRATVMIALTLHAGDLLGPGRRVGNVGVVVGRHPVAAEAAVEPVVGAEQVEDRGDQRLPVGELHTLDRDIVGQHLGVVAFDEVLGGLAAEIREVDADHVVAVVVEDQGHLERDRSSPSAICSRFQRPVVICASLDRPAAVPAAFSIALEPCCSQRNPTEPLGTTIRPVVSSMPTVFHSGLLPLAEPAVEIRRAELPARDQPALALVEPHQQRHVGVTPAVVLEVFRLPVEVELAQDHVAHRHRERAVGAGAGAEPDVAELRRLGVVGADHRGLRPAIARLGVEMRVRGAGLRHVRAPEDQEARIVPVRALGHVGLLAPGLRACRRQVAVPVVERHAGAAEQAQVARPGSVGDHRHRRDRREAEHPVGSVGLRGIGIGRRDDLGRLVPAGAHEAALAADLDVDCRSAGSAWIAAQAATGVMVSRIRRQACSSRLRIIGVFSRLAL